MEAPQKPSERSKWPGRMALLFTLLFAIFWSLGAFFFWTFLMLALYFAFLDFYYSDTLRRWVDGFSTAFQSRQTQPPPNPYQTFRPRTGPSETQAPQQVKARQVIRLVLFGFAFVLFFFFLVGLFSTAENSLATESTPVELPEQETGTTFWLEKGNAAMSNEKMDSALYYYGQTLALDPENMYGLYNTGLVYFLQDNYSKGNGFARRCLQYHPDYDPAWWLLGWGYDKAGKTDSAVYCLEQAYQHEYYQPEFLTLLSEVYIKTNKRRELLGVYQKMVDLDTTRADIFRRMAELDPSNAEKYMQKVRALEN